MSNGAVGQEVNKVEGNTVTVKYRGGDKAVTVTPSTKVVALVPGNRNNLKPNEKVLIQEQLRLATAISKQIA